MTIVNVATGPRPGAQKPVKLSIGDGPMGELPNRRTSGMIFAHRYQPPAGDASPVGGSKGLFTSTSPEMRRIDPEANGRTKLKLVYVVLEAQYQSALAAAITRINDTNQTVCVEVVGYLLEVCTAACPLPPRLGPPPHSTPCTCRSCVMPIT